MFDPNSMKVKDHELDENNVLGQLGLDFFRALFSTLKTASIYEANNNRYISQASGLRQIIAEVFTEDSKLSFVYNEGFYYINGIRITLEQSDSEASEYFKSKFEAINLEGFVIYSKAEAREIDKFVFALTHFKSAEDPEESYQNLLDKLNDLIIENISPARKAENPEKIEKEKDKNAKVKARKIFFKAINTVQEVISQAESGGKINLAKTKRVVQRMVDQIIENESSMAELTVLRDYDNYTFMHSVNVCIYALILGFHLNLDKTRLSDLGIGALLHDMGKVLLPVDLINKKESFDEDDWMMMRSHPIYGVKAIIRTRGTDRSSIRAVATAYEHHIGFDGSGYPELLQKRTPCLFAQIVAISDTFDAMISGRVYHKKKRTADEVITNMINRTGTEFNPQLLKTFINTIGIYPIGSVVQLNTDQVAIVSKANPYNPEKPEVKIIGDKNGMADEVKILDLSADEATDIKISKIIDGEKYNINPANFIDLG